jgi:hypothetical protein
LSKVMFKSLHRFPNNTADFLYLNVVVNQVWSREVDAKGRFDMYIFAFHPDFNRIEGTILTIVQDGLLALFNYCCKLMCNHAKICSRSLRESTDT